MSKYIEIKDVNEVNCTEFRNFINNDEVSYKRLQLLTERHGKSQIFLDENKLSNYDLIDFIVRTKNRYKDVTTLDLVLTNLDKKHLVSDLWSDINEKCKNAISDQIHLELGLGVSVQE